MFGLPFPTYLGWYASVGTMLFTLLLSLCLYIRYCKKEAAKSTERQK